MRGYDPTRTKIIGLLALVGVLAGLLGLARLYAAGSVVVRDVDGSITSAALRNDGRKIGIHRLPGGLHLSTARLEGEAVVRCSNGKAISLGYVTSGWHVWRTMRARDCSPNAPAIPS